MLPPLAVALAFSAMPAQPATASVGRVESISYRAGPCPGACLDYRFTVQSDGRGTFERLLGNAAVSRESFRVTTRQYQAFARHLAPLRPSRGNISFNGVEFCREIVSEHPHTIITWRPAGGGAQELNFYHGCRQPVVPGIKQRIESAPRLLPLGRFVRTSRARG